MRAEPDWLERDTGTADTPRPANDGGTRMSRFVSRSFLGFVLCAASVAAACAPPLSRSAAPPVAAPPAWWLFDGHIDVTVHYARARWDPAAYDLVSGETGQTNLTRLAVGRVGGGFFTCDSAVRTAPRWPGLADCLAFASRLARAHAGRVVLASTAADPVVARPTSGATRAAGTALAVRSPSAGPAGFAWSSGSREASPPGACGWMPRRWSRRPATERLG